MHRSELQRARPTTTSRLPLFYIMNEDTVKDTIRTKRDKFNVLAMQIATKRLDIKALERKRDTLRDEIYAMATLLPKIEKRERRMRLDSKRLQNSE